MINDQNILSIISEDVALRRVEAGIYSVYAHGEVPGSFDRFGAATIYDRVLCNSFYNWLMWGYSIKEYLRFCESILSSSSEGWVLDVACGSLAFTMKLYADYSQRPVVLLDQSLNLLRKAKSRLVKQKSEVPANIVLLHADALKLPIRHNSVHTIISLNLLHCLDDIKTVIHEWKRVLTDDGMIALTTLLRNDRWGDNYLNALSRSDHVVSRDKAQLFSVLNVLNMPIRHQMFGNLAFINCG